MTTLLVTVLLLGIYAIGVACACGVYALRAWRTRDNSRREVRQISRRHYADTGLVLPRDPTKPQR
jgi:hypothetical protein